MAPDWMPTHEMSLIGHQSVAEQEMEPLIQIYVLPNKIRGPDWIRGKLGAFSP